VRGLCLLGIVLRFTRKRGGGGGRRKGEIGVSPEKVEKESQLTVTPIEGCKQNNIKKRKGKTPAVTGLHGLGKGVKWAKKMGAQTKTRGGVIGYRHSSCTK